MHLSEELVGGAVGVFLAAVLEPGWCRGGGVEDVEGGFQADGGGDLGVGEEGVDQGQGGFGSLVGGGAPVVGVFGAGVLEGVGELGVGALPILDGGAVETAGFGDGGDALAFG